MVISSRSSEQVQSVANDDDLYVFQAVYGRCCIHENFSLGKGNWGDESPWWVEFVHCEDCGEDFFYRDMGQPVPKYSPKDATREYIPCYSKDPLLQAQLRRDFEARGWRLVCARFQGVVTCTIEKAGVSVVSAPCASDEAATANAIAELYRRGKLDRPLNRF